jgi:membrane protease subunit HflC
MTKVLLGGLAAVALLAASVYTLDAREVAVVTQFGRPVQTVTEPGLKFRAPWPLHQVVRYDSRVRLLSVDPAEVLTKDKKNLVVEAFVLWRVVDPERFLKAVTTPEVAATQLSDLVMSQVAASMGNRDFEELMAVDAVPAAMMSDDLDKGVSDLSWTRMGVEVLDVRLRHVGLPLQNEQSVYARMRAERARIANAYRSEGKEKAVVIRAEADRQAAEIIAGAEKEAAGIRAKAEGAAARVYAKSYAKDPEFFRFLRRLEAYESMLDEDTVMVVQSDGELFGALQEEVK